MKKQAKLEWFGQKCGQTTPEEPPDDVPLDGGYKPGDVENCYMCDNPDCYAIVRKVKTPRKKG